MVTHYQSYSLILKACQSQPWHAQLFHPLKRQFKRFILSTTTYIRTRAEQLDFSWLALFGEGIAAVSMRSAKGLFIYGDVIFSSVWSSRQRCGSANKTQPIIITVSARLFFFYVRLTMPIKICVYLYSYFVYIFKQQFENYDEKTKLFHAVRTDKQFKKQ